MKKMNSIGLYHTSPQFTRAMPINFSPAEGSVLEVRRTLVFREMPKGGEMTRITSFLIHLPLTFFSPKEPGCLVPHDATTPTLLKRRRPQKK